MGIDITSKVTRLEHYKNTRIPSDVAFAVRLDGSNFSKFTERYAKPFDEEFQRAMEHVVRSLCKEYSEIAEATTHSDEISLFFGTTANLFDRRHEKLVSELAGKASGLISQYTGEVAHFDARIILLPSDQIKDEYIRDRWLDAFRGCVNSVAYWTLRQQGMSKTIATSHLDKMKSKQKQELIFEITGVNVAELPVWQKQGLHFEYQEYTKTVNNPKTQVPVEVTRKALVEVGFNYLLN